MLVRIASITGRSTGAYTTKAVKVDVMIQTAYAYIKSRRAFKDPTQLQRFLVLFLDKENKPTGRMIPYEYWWNAPYKAARSKGLIRKSSFGLVFGAKTRATDKDFFWYLTPKG